MAFQDGKVIFVCHSSAVIRISANRLTKAGVNANLQDDSKAKTTKISTYQGDMDNTTHNANPLSQGNIGCPQKKNQFKDSKSPEGLEEFDQQIIETPKSTTESTDLRNIKLMTK